jgi:serine/threonine protein kinase
MTFVVNRYIHNFEQAYYETDRIDALAMSMLTFSPFVVDIYSYCGRTVITEFAGGPSLGSIFDKARKHDLKRLQIARDLALGLSHVHYGKEGNEDNAIFTHFDINPANVVVTNKRALRINDFNIAQMMKRNVTSGKQCNLPHHHFPNPQWRSPEEVNEFDHLSAKVDVFSLGHIFYRIICGHEPWNRLEQGRKPSSDVLARKVKAGILPRVPQNVMESTDPVVVAIRKAMFMCYTVDPMNRPSSKYVAAFLDEELKNLKLNRT